MTFRERRQYRDDRGKTWSIRRIVTLENRRRVFLMRGEGPVPSWAIAEQIEDDTAKVYLRIGYSIIYDDEEAD
jgi:hypothetical protein